MTLIVENIHGHLKTKNAYAFVDPNTRLIFYQYRDVITNADTEAVYKWTINGMETFFEEEDFRSAIFDFTQVKKFSIGNTITAKESSQEANEVADLSIFPIALIVTSTKQEVRVRMTMGEARRKRILYSEQEALTFINEWNVQHNRTFDVNDFLLTQMPKPMTTLKNKI